jgi:hypothetical protein
MTRDISKDILSACLLDSENLSLCLERGVAPEWFDRGGVLFSALSELSATKTWDKRTSMNVMAGIFAKHTTALDLTADTPEWAFRMAEMDGAIDVLHGEHIKRSLMSSTQGAQSRLMMGDDPMDVSGCLSASIEALGAFNTVLDLTTAGVVIETIEIDEKIARGEPLGLPFPWIDLQRTTFGIPYASVSPLVGLDGEGKSRLSTYLTHFWIKQGIPILYFAFEDGRNRFMSNLASSEGEYDMFTIKRYKKPDGYLEKHYDCLNKVGGMPIRVIDSFMDVKSIVSEIARADREFRKAGHENGVEGVIIDGLKDIILTEGDGTTGKEEFVSQNLTACARKYGPAIVPISHLTDLDDDAWISKRNIRGSKKQSQSARQVMIYQDSGIPSSIKEKYAFPYESEENNFVFQIAKASYGSKGAVALTKNLEAGKFDEIQRVL